MIELIVALILNSTDYDEHEEYLGADAWVCSEVLEDE